MSVSFSSQGGTLINSSERLQQIHTAAITAVRPMVGSEPNDKQQKYHHDESGQEFCQREKAA